MLLSAPWESRPDALVLRRVSRGAAISTVHRTAERASRRDFRICDLVGGDRVRQVTWVGSFDGKAVAHCESYKSQNRFEVRLSHETDRVFPTR